MNRSDLPLPSNRKFGWFFAGVFLACAAYAQWKLHSDVWSAWALLAALFALAAILVPDWLKPLNLAWAYLGLLLGKIVSPLVLGLIFLVLITPVGLITRALGRDPLRMKPIATASYWIPRDPAGPSPESFKNQF